MRLLLIESAGQGNRVLRTELERAGYLLSLSEGGTHAIASCLQGFPHALLIDTAIGLPESLTLCRSIRQATWLDTLPIMFLAADPAEDECLRCFDAGATDYLPRQISARELAVRIGRCAGAPERDNLRLGPLEVDFPSRRVTYRGKVVPMSPIEFSLLGFLLLHPDVVFTREELILAVWGPHATISARTIDVHVHRLRSKLEAQFPASCPIEGIRGLGVTVRRMPGARTVAG